MSAMINKSDDDYKQPLIQDDQSQEERPKTDGFCTRFFYIINWIKILGLVSVIFYLWIWTSAQRQDNLDVLQVMCTGNKFPERIVFHHDRILRTLSFTSKNKTANLDEEDRQIRAEMEAGGNGHYPAKNMISYTFKKEKDSYGKIVDVPVPTPKLSMDLKEAILTIGKAEMFDKTWLLLVILTVSWSTWHYDDDKHDHEETKDLVTGEKSRIVQIGQERHAHVVGFQTHPLRIFLPATFGIIIINIKSILQQDNIYVNETRIFVCLVLVLVLVNYMFSICSQHLENIVSLEKYKNDHKKDDLVEDKQKLLDEFKAKEERNKVIRKIQRDLTIKYNLLYKLGERNEAIANEKHSKSFSQLKSDVQFQINLNNTDDLFKEFSKNGISQEAIEREFIKSARKSEREMEKQIEFKAAEQVDIDVNDLDKGESDEDKNSQSQITPSMRSSDNMTAMQVAATKTKKKILTGAKYFQYLISLLSADIIFAIFMCTQEIDDTSFLKTFQLRAIFYHGTLIEAVIIVHAAWNFVVVFSTFIFTWMLMSQRDSNIFGCIIIYLIVTYEFLFHILRWAALYLQIQ